MGPDLVPQFNRVVLEVVIVQQLSYLVVDRSLFLGVANCDDDTELLFKHLTSSQCHLLDVVAE